LSAANSVDFVSHSSLHTERVGERIARLAQEGDVIALWGELGAGKTVLTKGIATGLGLEAADITSPTFIIMHEHLGGRLPLFHIDLYRLSGRDLGTTGWEETFDAGGVTVIEWPERAGDALPPERVDVTLEHIADTKRRIVLRPHGPRAEELVEAFRSSLSA
jgi:tRNA threonylcarbamoyladenosine biosynthesis protein TsaE